MPTDWVEIAKINLALFPVFFISVVMRIIFTLLTVYIALVVFSSFAMAIENPSIPENIIPAKEIASDSENAQIPSAPLDEGQDIKNPVSVILGPWEVKERKQSNGFPSYECVMHADYNNGLRLTFKGVNGKLRALRIKAIDGTKPIAVKGFIGLGFDKNSYGLQSRSNNGQIDASLISVGHVDQKLITAAMFRLRIGMKDYYFSTNGFADGYRGLLECQGVHKIQTLKVVNEPRLLPNKALDVMPANPVGHVDKLPVIDVTGEIELKKPSRGGNDVPLAMALPMIVPSDYTYNLGAGVDPLQKISWKDDRFWPETLQETMSDLGYSVFVKDTNVRIALKGTTRDTGMAKDDFKPVTPTSLKENEVDSSDEKSFKWVGREGEKIADVLTLWAQIANVDVNIDLDGDPVLTQDFEMTGRFEDAVQGVLSTTTGIHAQLDTGDDKVTLAENMSIQPLPQRAVRSKTVSEPYRWRALAGTNLKSVLKLWSHREKVVFQWDMDQMILIPESLKIETSYEDAVSSLLDLFKGSSIRPVAQLNEDPNTGLRTLIIKNAVPQK